MAYEAYVAWYNCDNIDDIGWGCGWRCIQMCLGKLFSIRKTIREIRDEMKHIGFTMPNDEKYGYLDGEMLFKYFNNRFDCFVQRIDIDVQDKIQKFIDTFRDFSDPKIGVIFHDGGVFVIDKIDDKGLFILDPHTTEKKFQEMTKLGQGGFGYCDVNTLLFQNEHIINVPRETYLSINTPIVYLLTVGKKQ